MTKRYAMLILIVHALSTSCRAEDSIDSMNRLVEAMELERVVQLKLIHDATSPVEVECIQRKSTGAISDAVVDALRSELSSSEAEFLSEFYESSAGRKYTQKAIVNISQSIGVHTNQRMPTYSHEEEMKIAKFAESEAGRKLLFGGASKAMSRAVAFKSFQIGFDCR